MTIYLKYHPTISIGNIFIYLFIYYFILFYFQFMKEENLSNLPKILSTESEFSFSKSNETNNIIQH